MPSPHLLVQTAVYNLQAGVAILARGPQLLEGLSRADLGGPHDKQHHCRPPAPVQGLVLPINLVLAQWTRLQGGQVSIMLQDFGRAANQSRTVRAGLREVFCMKTAARGAA